MADPKRVNIDYYDSMSYEVSVPESKYSYKLKDIRTKNEMALKGSLLMSRYMIYEHIDRFIYNSIISSTNKKMEIGTEDGFNEFLRSTTPLDREMLLFGIYVNNYNHLYKIKDSRCQNPSSPKTNDRCEHVFKNIEFDLRVSYKETPYTGKPGELTKIRNNIKINDIVEFTTKYPTLESELQVVKQDIDDDSIKIFNKIDSVTISVKNKTDEGKEEIEKITYKEFDNILFYYENLRPKDRLRINEEYENMYKSEFVISHTEKCPLCGYENKYNVLMIIEFFRMVREL